MQSVAALVRICLIGLSGNANGADTVALQQYWENPIHIALAMYDAQNVGRDDETADPQHVPDCCIPWPV